MFRFIKLNRFVEGWVVIVIGVVSGMGCVIVYLFVDEGVMVVVIDINVEGVEVVIKEIIDVGLCVCGW